MTKARKQGQESDSAPAEYLPPKKRAHAIVGKEFAHRKTAELIPFAKNSRTHSVEQVEQIMASIREWGFTNPILIDEHGMVIAGHGRLMAAERLQLEEVPCIIAAGWSEEQKRAYVIADNQLPLNAGWDTGVLASELQALNELGFDIGLIGMDDDMISKLLPEPERAYTGDPDDAPKLERDCVSRPGDLWLLGSHRLLCGDSTDLMQVQRLMDAFEADLLLTDPPYNVDYEGSNGKKIKNDSMGDGAFRQFLRDALSSAHAVMRAGAAFYIWYSDVETANFSGAVVETFGQLRQVLIWKKDSLIMGRKDYHWMHEPCIYGWKDGAAHSWFSDRKQTSVMEHPKPAKNDDHPTMKPVGLIEYQIKNSSKAGDIVLDLFLGSGSTLIASEKSGRRCFGMELDPRYCDVIVKRWQEFTGKRATLEDGRTFAEISNGR